MTAKRIGSWKTVSMSAEQLAEVRPLPEHLAHPNPSGLVEAFITMLEQPDTADVRQVCVSQLLVRKERVNKWILNQWILDPPPFTKGPQTGAIPVVELSDGRLLAFDDAHTVSLWHRTSPGKVVPVVVISFTWPENEMPIS